MAFRAHLTARLFLLFAAFAAVVQWSVPHGWMIAHDADGDFVLVPCPSDTGSLGALAQSRAASSPEHHAHHAHHQTLNPHAFHEAMGHSDQDGAPGMAEALCDQAAFGSPALPPLALDVSDTRFALGTDAFTVLEVTPGHGLAAPPPPSTGPPTLNA